MNTSDDPQTITLPTDTDQADDIQTELPLNEEKRFYSSIIQSAAAPMCVIDSNHTILFWNNAMAKLTGFSSFQMKGTRQQWQPFYPEKRPLLADLIIDQDLDVIKDYYTGFDASNSSFGTYCAEGWYDDIGGQRRYLMLEASAVKNSRNEIIAAIETINDITDIKLAQEAMQNHNSSQQAILKLVEKAKREWEQTLDSLRDFVILTDSEHRVRRCNRLLCDMTGKPFNEVINRDWRDLVADAGFTCTSFNGTTGELVHDESKHNYDINIYTMTEQDSGEISGFVISLNDTTELRAMTEELKRTSRELHEAQSTVFQQEKMASIGQLAAGVAHEINNPMGFISSNLTTLDKYLERFREFIAAQERELSELTSGGIPDRIRDLRKKLKIDFILDDTKQLIAESQDGASRVRRIVQDLKSFSRVDQAEYSLVDLNECLETTINIAWNEIKYIASVHRDFGQIPQVKCFPQQLNQVFLNLLINAAQALKEQGEIKVRTWSEENSVLVSVSDTGSGIPPDIINRIFEPFFTTKEVGKGTGLGLSISYDIIKKHGGVMNVESQVGKGTTFTIRLPLEPVVEIGETQDNNP